MHQKYSGNALKTRYAFFCQMHTAFFSASMLKSPLNFFMANATQGPFVHVFFTIYLLPTYLLAGFALQAGKALCTHTRAEPAMLAVLGRLDVSIVF